MNKMSIEFKCPKCGTSVMASMEEDFGSYVIYPCPKCHSNVVFYDKKVDIISDKMLNKLLKKGVLKFCGHVTKKSGPEEHPSRENISKDDILNLKIDLETAPNVDSFLDKI